MSLQYFSNEAYPETKLHLSDVEFRSETIYFLVLDRFHSGNPRTLNLANELDDPSRTDWNKYWGGDLQGLLDKLDYLQDMGVTAIWITPLFEQVEGISIDNRAPMHGYWTRDFKRINRRWVNHPDEVRVFAREDTVFDRLLAELHRRGMKFILDIVCNHSSPKTMQGKGRLYDDGKLVADFEDDSSAWYHHYGKVTNWEDEWQIQNCELEGLATFNENNDEYRAYIKGAIKCWLDKGVDALRVDTVKHMPIWFWQEFTADMETHKPDVFIFGEWIHSHPLNEKSMAYANTAGMSLLDFGFCESIRQCLGKNAPEGFELVQTVLAEDRRYRSANELVTFFENHDFPRLQSLDSRNSTVDLAIILLLCSRGIPCLYYGSEQYLHDDTDGGNDPYNRLMMEVWDRQSKAYGLIRKLSIERRTNQALQWGGQWSVLVEPDVYVFLRRYGHSVVLVALNRREAEREVVLKDLDFPDGRHRCLLSGFVMEVKEGGATLPLAAREGMVFSVSPENSPLPRSVTHVQLNGAPVSSGDRVFISGDCPELGAWKLAEAVKMECVNSNLWFIDQKWTESIGKSVAYKYVIEKAAGNSAPVRESRVVRRRNISEGIGKWRDVWEE